MRQALSSTDTTSRMNFSVSASAFRVIPQMIRQQRERQLPRPVALISPFEPHRAEPLQIEPRIQRPAIDRDDRAIQAAPALIDFHANITTLRTVSPRFNAANPSLISSSPIRAEIISSSFNFPSRYARASIGKSRAGLAPP